MTALPIHSSAEAGVKPNKRPVADYARVIEGRMFWRVGGRMVQADRWAAVMELAALESSPYPESQERARQIRAALKETRQ